MTNVLKIYNKIFDPDVFYNFSDYEIADNVYDLFIWLYYPSDNHKFANIQKLLSYASLIGILDTLLNIKFLEYNKNM